MDDIVFAKERRLQHLDDARRFGPKADASAATLSPRTSENERERARTRRGRRCPGGKHG